MSEHTTKRDVFMGFGSSISAEKREDSLSGDLDLAVGEVAHLGVERDAGKRDLLAAPKPLLVVALRL